MQAMLKSLAIAALAAPCVLAQRTLLQAQLMGAVAPAPSVPATQAASVAAPGTAGSPSAGVSSLDILQFALNLECLEAQFYSCATTGQGLNGSLTGNGPAPQGCQRASLTSITQTIAQQLASDELNHVAYLRQAISQAGATPIACPALNLTNATFTSIVNAAFAPFIFNATTFSPYQGDLQFLQGAFLFEDLGVSAYQGGAALLPGGSPYLAPAAGLLAAEAYHSGAIRALLIQNIGLVELITGQGNITVDNVIYNEATLENSASLANPSSQPRISYGVTSVYRNATNSNAALSALLVPAANAIPVARTPAQVLNVVYGGNSSTLSNPRPTSLSFFPNGLNGNIK